MEVRKRQTRNLRIGTDPLVFKVREVKVVLVLLVVKKETVFIPHPEDLEMAAKISHLRHMPPTRQVRAGLGENPQLQEQSQPILINSLNPTPGSEPQSTLSKRSSINHVNAVPGANQLFLKIPTP